MLPANPFTFSVMVSISLTASVFVFLLALSLINAVLYGDTNATASFLASATAIHLFAKAAQSN